MPEQRIEGELGHIALFGDNIKRLAILVLSVGIAYEAVRKSATDGELEVSWDCLVIAYRSDRQEEVLEVTGVVLVS